MPLSRAFQWAGVAAVLLVLVGLNYEFESKAGMQMNAAPESPLSQSLRGYWKLDDGSGTNATDASGNGNTLAMTGSPSWVAGQIGPSSLDFSGTGQYLSVADPSSGVLDIGDSTDFSITGWFNRDTFANDHTIVAKRNSSATNTDAGYIVWIDAAADKVNFTVGDGGGTAGDQYTLASTSTFTATGWHQFTAVWDDSLGMQLYIDGKLDNSTTSSTSSIGSLANALAFRIGAESDAGNPFDGKLDDIRIYGYALSADQVKKVYNTTSPTQPVDTSLVGHWTFDGPDVDSVNGVVRDRSKSGNDGTFTPAHIMPAIGKLGQALHQDGTAWESLTYLNSGRNLEMGTGDISIATWINLIASSAAVFFAKGGENEEGYIFYYDEINQRVAVSIHTGAASTSYYADTPFDLRGSGWHHVTSVIDRDAGVLFYLDGVFLVKDGTSVYNGTDITNTGLTGTIGSADANGGDVASYDDFRIYNRALSASEVANLYDVGK